MNKRVIHIITLLRDTSDISEKIYLEGGCYKLYQLLKEVFPNAIAWYDGIEGHVYTEISGKYYDIRGEHGKQAHWYPMHQEPEIEKEADTWKYEFNLTQKK